MYSRLAVSPRTAAVVMALWLTACGTDTLPTVPPPADPGYRSLHVQDEASLGVTATGMMAGIGCTAVRGRPDSTAVAIPLLPGTIKFYRCPGVRRATLLATAKAIKAVTANNPVWASALSGGAGGSPYYDYDHTECVWQESRPPEYGQRINADGDFEVFVMVDAQPGSCAWMAIYKYKVPDGTGTPSTGEIGTIPTGGTGWDAGLLVEVAGPLLDPGCTTADRSRCPGIRMPRDSMQRIRAAIGRIASGGECGAIRAGLMAVDDSRFYLASALPASPGYVRLAQISYAVPLTSADVTAIRSTSILVLSQAGLSGRQRKLETVLAHEYIHVLFYTEYGMAPTTAQELEITRRAEVCT